MPSLWLRALVVAAAVVLGAAGCARSRPELVLAMGGTPSELVFWNSLLESFTRQTGIPVTLEREPSDTDQRREGLLTALAARQSQPDLFLMDVAWMRQFAASGWLAPLDPLVAQSRFDLSVFFPGILNAADRYRGALVALPMNIDGGLLYYRKDLLARYGYRGPPATWDELAAWSGRVQKLERRADPAFYGYVWQGAQYEGLVCNFLEVAASAGGGLPEENGRVRVDSSANRRALAWMAAAIGSEGISPPQTFSEMREEETRLYFQQGHALFERNWPYAWPLHEAPGSPVRGKVGIAPLPHFTGGASAAALGGSHLGISRFSRRQSDAWRLLTYLVSAAAQKRIALEIGWNPGRRDLYRDPALLQKLPYLKELGEVFARAVPRPLLPYYTQISDRLQPALNGALAGRRSPAEALAEAQRDADRWAARYASPAASQ